MDVRDRENLSEEQLLLLESVRARTGVAPIAVIGSLLPAVIFVPFFLNENISLTRIMLWVLPFSLALIARALYSMRMQRQIDELDDAALNRADQILRGSSILNQLLLGTGIWLIHAPGEETMVIPLFVTMMVVMFCFGAMTNLVSDYRSFAVSMPLALGQPIAFFVLQGGLGWAIAVAMSTSLALMYAYQSRANAIWVESILMRFEKDKLLEEVRQANDSKAFFIASASHDIKQPLSALQLLGDTMLLQDPGERIRPMLEQQHRTILRMNDLFDDLMDLNRFERGGVEPLIQPYSTRQLALALDDEFEPLCQEKSLAWHRHVAEHEIHTDPALLTRLCRNLVSNAVRYTRQGSVAFHAVPQDAHMVFRVEDTGPGIPPEDEARIFDQFVRLDSTRDDASGVGLGLTIVRHIADALNTRVSVKSRPGEGTAFEFSLPLAVSQSA